MRLDDLLRQLADRGGPRERTWERFSLDAGGTPSRARLGSYSTVKPEDVFTTAWGTEATMPNAIDPPSVMGIARAGRLTYRPTTGRRVHLAADVALTGTGLTTLIGHLQQLHAAITRR